MKNRKFVKPLLVVVAMVLVCVISVLATIAYLTDSSEVVKNTFTVGDVEISLNEAKVDVYGALEYVLGDDGEPTDTLMPRVTGNEYKLVANHTYVKDPTVTVAANSEPSYVRAIIRVTGANDLFTATTNSYTAENFLTGFGFTIGTGWAVNATTTVGDVTYYEVRYNNVVDTLNGTALALPNVFGTFTTPANLGNTELENLADLKIDVVAQAIQENGFKPTTGEGGAVTATAADNAFAELGAITAAFPAENTGA